MCFFKKLLLLKNCYFISGTGQFSSVLVIFCSRFSFPLEVLMNLPNYINVDEISEVLLHGFSDFE